MDASPVIGGVAASRARRTHENTVHQALCIGRRAGQHAAVRLDEGRASGLVRRARGSTSLCRCDEKQCACRCAIRCRFTSFERAGGEDRRGGGNMALRAARAIRHRGCAASEFCTTTHMSSRVGQESRRIRGAVQLHIESLHSVFDAGKSKQSGAAFTEIGGNHSRRKEEVEVRHRLRQRGPEPAARIAGCVHRRQCRRR